MHSTLKKTAPLLGCLLAFSLLSACQSPKKEKKTKETVAVQAHTLKPLDYDLQHPVKVSSLPPVLKEISGITYVKPGQLAAINDEQGDLFLINYQTGKMTEQRIWGNAGDYEDIVYHEGKFYVLRSDGQLFIFTLDQTYLPGGVISGESKSMRTFNLQLPGQNEVEGLTFDSKTGWFFVAAKETKKAKDERYVYFYDPQKNASWKGIVLRKKSFEEVGLTGKDTEFKPSAIATHPQTKEVYILASVGHKLLVLDRKGGNFVAIEKLDPKVFEQPEGLCFAPDGTLFLSSEGKKGPGKIWEFKPRTK